MISTDNPAPTRRPGAPPDQSEVIAFLDTPSTFGPAIETVDRIETHGALIFLAGDRVYKLKRAVKLPYLDFSTLDKRAAACEHEIERNRPAAPEIYIGTLPIVRREDGALALGGEGVPVDWVVVMNRFDQAGLFDNLAQKNRLPLAHMTSLAEQVADYHDNATVFRSIDGGASMATTIGRLVRSLYEAGDVIGLDRAKRFARQIVAELNARNRLLCERARGGHVRLCHGDLHLRNIVLHGDRATLFDAIEFDDRLATTDVLYDLAFLLMDLWHRDLKAHANRCFGSYASKAIETKDLGGLATLPLFLSTRAAVRAVVAIDQLALAEPSGRQEHIEEIDAYLSLAMDFLAPAKPVLIAIGGLSGTGKTSVSASLAPRIGRAPGALHLRSDVERKRMAGVDPLARLPQSAYSRSNSDKVYHRLFERAERALKAGQSVIVDAVFQEAAHRRAIEQVAARAQVPFFAAWLVAPQAQLIERVERRKNDASDAGATVVVKQFAKVTRVTCWETIDAAQEIVDVVRQIRVAMPERFRTTCEAHR